MLKIDTTKMEILSDFQIEEKVYPFREGKTRVFGYRTIADDSIVMIATYYTDGQEQSEVVCFSNARILKR